MKLYEGYKELGLSVDAKLVLETEDYTKTKKELAEVYYKEGDFVKSRDAQDDLEYIATHKPDYYYKSIDEKEAYEYNELYSKEINELLIQAKEANRDENQLLYWEKYALELIKESALPVAIEAEKLLKLNNETVAEHKIEVPIVNGTLAANNSFVYNMGVIPNPAMYQTSVLINMPSTSENAVLKLYDSFNTQMLLEEHSLEAGDNIVEVNVATYTSGLYTFVVEVDNQIVVSKHLVIIH